MGTWLWLGLLAGTLRIPCPADFVDMQQIEPSMVVNMPYGTSANVAGQALYPVQRCLLRREVGLRLQAVQRALRKTHDQLRLLLWDCYRPLDAQRKLYQVVAGSKKAGYVANPDGPRAAVHTYGAAVDVSLWDSQAEAPIAMGTGFDFFGALAEPRREARLVEQGLLSAKHLENRLLLRRLMQKVGRFRSIPNEWWHFDAWQGQALRQRYQPANVALDCTIDSL